MTVDKFLLAKMKREKNRRRWNEVYDACQCEFPLRVWRNGHGHGPTKDGGVCPAVDVITRHKDEDTINAI